MQIFVPPNAEMLMLSRRGRGGSGLAAAAQASAATHLAEAVVGAVATLLPAIPPIRTSPHLQQSSSLLLTASTPVNVACTSTTTLVTKIKP